MQVDPIKPKLKLPGTKRLKLKCDTPLSDFAFRFQLRRYTLAGLADPKKEEARLGKQAGAYTGSR